MYVCVTSHQWVPNVHYYDVIMGAIASQNTSLTIVYSNVYLGADQRKHESSGSLAFVQGIHRGPVNSPHKWPVTRKMFPFDWRHHVIQLRTSRDWFRQRLETEQAISNYQTLWWPSYVTQIYIYIYIYMCVCVCVTKNSKSYTLNPEIELHER